MESPTFSQLYNPPPLRNSHGGPLQMTIIKVTCALMGLVIIFYIPSCQQQQWEIFTLSAADTLRTWLQSDVADCGVERTFTFVVVWYLPRWQFAFFWWMSLFENSEMEPLVRFLPSWCQSSSSSFKFPGDLWIKKVKEYIRLGRDWSINKSLRYRVTPMCRSFVFIQRSSLIPIIIQKTSIEHHI